MKMKIELLSHSNLVEIVHNLSNGTEQEFGSKLISKRSFRKGDIITHIENYIEVDQPTYLTVQIGPTKHIYLNSDFMYMNHSCDPNVRIDIKRMAYIAAKDILPGDDLSFFYPSTEWDMDQPFECWCDSRNCLRLISGAKYIEPHVMNQLREKHFFSDCIADLFVNEIVY